MPQLSAPKGTKDILSDQYYARQQVANTILRVLERYGYRQVVTPGFENIEVLTAKAGEAIIEQIYEFHDKGGRHLGLRSDITASVGRMVAPKARVLPKPIKISSYDRVWRYERPQSGRFREFFQINAEMFGASGAQADAELIACFCDCYNAIQLTDYKIHIGHRRLLETLIASLGVAGDDLLAVIRAVDKAPKLAEQDFHNEVLAAGLPADALPRLAAFMDLKGPLAETLHRARDRYDGIPALVPMLDELEQISGLLRMYRVDEQCMLDLAIARGSDYYTAIIFECIYNTDLVGSIGGGGRYDNLIELYGGPSLPAVGFSVGFERVMVLLNSLPGFDAQSFIPPLEYYVAISDPTLLGEAIAIAQNLRQNDHTVEVDLLARDLKGQVAQAAKLGAAQVVIVGADELARRAVVVRDMATRSERTVEIKQLIGRKD